MKHPKYVTVKFVYLNAKGEQKTSSFFLPYDATHTMDCNVQHVIDFVHLKHSVYSIGSVVLKY